MAGHERVLKSRPPVSASTRRHFFGTRAALLALLLLLCGTTAQRLVHLDADPASWFIDEIGYQIDEGYKTLSPRNLALFGATHWNPQDQYGGWMRRSALTQWPYFWAFNARGVQLSSARVVSVLFAVLFLAITAGFLWFRYSPGLALLGTLLLTADPGLFLFSRSALFETALALYTFSALYLAVSLPRRVRGLSPVVLLLLTAPAFLFLKKTILLYAGPAALGLLIAGNRPWLEARHGKRSYLVGLAVAAVAIAATVAVLFRAAGGNQLDLVAIVRHPQMIFLNPTELLSPVALILGYLALLDLLVRDFSTVVEDPYRLSLALIIVLAPIGLSFFAYNNPRYYIPIIPAALLMVVERLAVRTPGRVPTRFRLQRGGSVVVVFLALCMTALATFNHYVLARLPINVGGDPGLSDPGLLRVYPLIVVAVGGVAYLLASRGWRGPNRRWLEALIAIHVMVGLGITARAVAAPQHETQAIQQEIVQQVNSEQSLGGDWAPYFVVGTSLRVLYMRPDINGAGDVKRIRPDFFLFSDTPYDRKNLAQLERDPTISLDPPKVLGTYARRPILLYRIRYRPTAPAAATATPPAA